MPVPKCFDPVSAAFGTQHRSQSVLFVLAFDSCMLPLRKIAWHVGQGNSADFLTVNRGMFEFGSCLEVERLDLLQAAGCSIGLAAEAVLNDTRMSLVIVACVISTLVIHRSVAIALAVLIVSLLLAEPISQVESPVNRRVLIGTFGAALALLWLGGIRSRQLASRQRALIATVSAEKDEAQAKLDREITWRRAAEPAPDAPSAHHRPD